jgi:aspartyl-tRNA(Asn)/glutamyl-tRNA(Gln) amidotransferase subunit B
MEHAIEFEARRQIEILEAGGAIEQETRLYDPERDETRSMRTKEEAHDYRYFPDPDLLPLVVAEELIDELRRKMPELPEAKRARFVEKGVPTHAAELLVASRESAEFFERVIAAGGAYEASANLMIGDLAALLAGEQKGYGESPVAPEELAALERRVADGTISGKICKELLRAKFAGEKTSIDELIESRGLRQISDAGAIEKLVDEVLAKNARQVADYRAGKDKAFNSLVGQVMKATQGKANPAQVNEILRKKLNA